MDNCYLVSNCNLILNRSDKLIVKTHLILQTNVCARQIGHETRNPQGPAACKPEPTVWVNHEEVGNTSYMGVDITGSSFGCLFGPLISFK